jgi:hypothetical protein
MSGASVLVRNPVMVGDAGIEPAVSLSVSLAPYVLDI